MVYVFLDLDDSISLNSLAWTSAETEVELEMEITSVSLIRRWPCIDKGGSPLDSALHSFRALFINISGHFWGLRISCFSPEHLVQVKVGTLTASSHHWELVESCWKHSKRTSRAICSVAMERKAGDRRLLVGTVVEFQSK
ncbi:hypothetical protein ABKV19_027390 [Rosa sericea]